MRFCTWAARPAIDARAVTLEAGSLSGSTNARSPEQARSGGDASSAYLHPKFNSVRSASAQGGFATKTMTPPDGSA